MSKESESALALRNKLLVTLGLAAPVLPGCWAFVKCDNPTETLTLNLDARSPHSGADTATSDTSSPEDTAAPLTECPTDRDAVQELVYNNDQYCQVDELSLVEQVDRDCTYEVTCWTCCGYGRPYLDREGQPVSAETERGGAWSGGERWPVATALTEQQRARVGAYWLHNAVAEHSSVAGFLRFALDLLAHGAPPDLVARAQRAAAQELEHAIDCFTLASAYLGEPVGPAPMSLGASAPIARDLAELAAWTTRDGAVGETIAAFLAEQALAATTEPAVRRVLADIVADETEHAALAWATLRWALSVGGDEVRAAIEGVIDGLGAPQTPPAPWSPELAAHGVPSPDQEPLDAALAVQRIIRPVAEALLAEAPPRIATPPSPRA